MAKETTINDSIQANILSIDTSNNPALLKINSSVNGAKKYVLETKYKKITPAINELDKNQKTLTQSVTQSVKSIADTVGNTAADPELKNKFEECVASLSTVTDINVLNIVMDMLQRIRKIEDKGSSSTGNIEFATVEEVLEAMDYVVIPEENPGEVTD